MPKLYNIIRFYEGRPSRTIKSGVTLREAKEHCQNHETSSVTCSLKSPLSTQKWFDGYTEQKTYESARKPPSMLSKLAFVMMLNRGKK